LADEAAGAEGGGATGEVEELPTMPPAPGPGQSTLRWATPGPVPRGGREAARRLRPEPGRAPAPARQAVSGPVRDEPTSPVHVPPGPPPAAWAGAGGGSADAAGDGVAGAGPGGEADQGEGGPAARGGRRRVTALLVLVGSLLALAAVAGVIVWRVGEVNGSPPRTTVTVPAGSPEALFEGLLATSATAHQLAQAAVAGPCRTAARTC